MSVLLLLLLDGSTLHIETAARFWEHCEFRTLHGQCQRRNLTQFRRIFERDAHGECLNLIIGSKPSTHSVPSAISPSISDLRLSAHYASALAQLADDRGFDGWLLNFECSLTHAEEEARVLSAWIRLLKHELKKRVGPHAEVIW